MIDILEKDKCCGCSACSSVCPQHCIEMRKDEEGFLYPEIQEDLCIKCNKCEKVCPIIHYNRYEKKQKTNCYIVQNKDHEVIRESTSGGFFSALAEYIFENNGVVYGAYLDEKIVVRHVKIVDKKDLKKLRNSKYCQSDIHGLYSDCEKELKLGKMVCFSGTPCQLAGLKSYLGREYNNLISVDVVCRGVASPLLFEKFLQANNKNDISTVLFRDKHYGYYASTMTILYKSGRVKRNEINSSLMLKPYFNDFCSRPSCYKCKFKIMDRNCDFTMFDCWHANRYNNKFGIAGSTGVAVRSEKADKIFKNLVKRLLITQVDYDELVKLDGYMMTQMINKPEKRKEFFKLLSSDRELIDIEKLFFRQNLMDRIKYYIKLFLMKTRIFNLYMLYKMR